MRFRLIGTRSIVGGVLVGGGDASRRRRRHRRRPRPRQRRRQGGRDRRLQIRRPMVSSVETLSWNFRPHREVGTFAESVECEIGSGFFFKGRGWIEGEKRKKKIMSTRNTQRQFHFVHGH